MVDCPAYKTPKGATYNGDSIELLRQVEDNSIDLIMTSPPFALLRKKEYGNEEQNNYVQWLARFAEEAYPKLKETGSLVIDLGGAYERGIPIRSLYNFRVLIHFCDILHYHLAEEFYWYNPSKLPSPIEWVNKRKIRAKDSVNTVWWFSKGTNPKSDVRKVLTPYSDRMKELIKDPQKFYKAKERPSGHNISYGFANDNGGAIPSNLLQISNSESNSKYLFHCKSLGIKAHPARFPSKLPEFFVKMLTDEGDTVVDIFGGSCTTGEVCERLNRKWMCFELDRQYVANSVFRFVSDTISETTLRKVYDKICNGENIEFDITTIESESNLF